MKTQNSWFDGTLRGWDVTRGKTWVELKDGTKGIITEWHGGYFTLDHVRQGHRNDVVKWGDN